MRGERGPLQVDPQRDPDHRPPFLAADGRRKPPPVLRLLNEATLKRISYYPRASAAVLCIWDDLPSVARLETVASHVGMSATAFSRYFTEKVGMTFSEVTKLLRIEAALDELERRDCAIALLARCSGYRSGCAFTRAFREVLGETPSQYRRRLLSG